MWNKNKFSESYLWHKKVLGLISPNFFRQAKSFRQKIRRLLSLTKVILGQNLPNLCALFAKQHVKFADRHLPIQKVSNSLSEKGARKCWWNRPLIFFPIHLLPRHSPLMFAAKKISPCRTKGEESIKLMLLKGGMGN